MKTYVLALFGSILIYFPANSCAQIEPSPPPTADLLDPINVESTKYRIDKAFKNNDLDQLFIAMHNPRIILKIYCLDRISTLPASSQAALIARLLLDDTLLDRADKGGLRDLNEQTEIQVKLERMSYKLLGQNPPVFHGILTSVESNNLAASLQMIH